MTLKKTLTSTLLALWAITANAQQGAWKGELNVMGNKLPLVFNFTKDGLHHRLSFARCKRHPSRKDRERRWHNKSYDRNDWGFV